MCLCDHHRQQEKKITLKLREKLLDNQRRKHLKEAADAKRRANLVRAVLAHGGPCETKTDARRLRRRLEESGQRRSAIKEAFKNEIRSQKTVLNSKGTLKLSGNISDLAKARQDLPQDQSAASPPSPGLPTQQCPGGEPLPQPPPPKCRHPESSADAGPSALPESETAGDPDDLPFSFSGQGQWVATYYDEQFFTGQVIEVHDPQSAVVQYLEQLKGRSNLFKWPKVEDVAETDCIICI